MFHAFIVACALSASGGADCDVYQNKNQSAFAERTECRAELKRGLTAIQTMPGFQEQLEKLSGMSVRAVCHEAEGNWNPEDNKELIMLLYGPQKGQDS